MAEAINKLTQTQMDFIKNEFGVTKEQLQNMSEDEFFELNEKICDIEVHETMLADDDSDALSERGEIAASIVTLFGESVAEDDDFDTDDEE